MHIINLDDDSYEGIPSEIGTEDMDWVDFAVYFDNHCYENSFHTRGAHLPDRSTSRSSQCISADAR